MARANTKACKVLISSVVFIYHNIFLESDMSKNEQFGRNFGATRIWDNGEYGEPFKFIKVVEDSYKPHAVFERIGQAGQLVTVKLYPEAVEAYQDPAKYMDPALPTTVRQSDGTTVGLYPKEELAAAVAGFAGLKQDSEPKPATPKAVLRSV